jgi:hypothetical protein
MKLPIGPDIPEGEKRLAYFFQLGEDVGINVALSRDDKSAIADRAGKTKSEPDDVSKVLLADADDKVFRLDRVDAQDCASLNELAALRHE